MEGLPIIQERLCQMDKKSCGGCCCIEIPDDDKNELAEAFRRRRRAYKKHLLGADGPDVAGYEAEIKQSEPLLSVDTLEETLDKKCHFLGFTNDEETKIGCLAHPALNSGEDLRKHGFYKDEVICDKFLCASAQIYETLTPWQKQLFRVAIEGWNWYDMSDQDEMYRMIKKFEESLPAIESVVNKTIDPETVRRQIAKIME